MRVAALACVLALAACAPAPIKPQFSTVEFELLGRLAARYQEESFTGNVTWKHAGDADEMLISTPLGQGVARIARQGDAVVLATAEPREYRSNDVEELTERVLGFRIPVAGLAEWVQGRPSPELERRGWKIEYQERDAQQRPIRMRMTYPGIELRLAITAWK